MPRLSQYVAASGGATTTPQPPPQPPQPQQHQQHQQDPPQLPAFVSQPPAPLARIAPELGALRRLHDARVREHGPRLFRHADGSLRPVPPPREPLTVASRARWLPMARHARTRPGVDPELAAAAAAGGGGGASARYLVGVSYEQHAAALRSAGGLQPEFDASGRFLGGGDGGGDGDDDDDDDDDDGAAAAGAAAGDPLAERDPATGALVHPLARGALAGVTREVLRRALKVHGEAHVLGDRGWRGLWEAVA